MIKEVVEEIKDNNQRMRNLERDYEKKTQKLTENIRHQERDKDTLEKEAK